MSEMSGRIFQVLKTPPFKMQLFKLWCLRLNRSKILSVGNFLAVQLLALGTSTAMVPGSIPGQGTKIPQAAWCSHKTKTNKKTTTKTQNTRHMTFTAKAVSPPHMPVPSADNISRDAAECLGDVRTLPPCLPLTSSYRKEILLCGNSSAPFHFPSSPLVGIPLIPYLNICLCLLVNAMQWMHLGRRNSRRWGYGIKAAKLRKRMRSGKSWYTWQ